MVRAPRKQNRGVQKFSQMSDTLMLGLCWSMPLQLFLGVCTCYTREPGAKEMRQNEDRDDDPFCLPAGDGTLKEDRHQKSMPSLRDFTRAEWIKYLKSKCDLLEERKYSFTCVIERSLCNLFVSVC